MQLIQKVGLPTEAFIQVLLEKLIKALTYLSKKDIIHRDLKLENIMVKNPYSKNPQPVIIDFGLSEYADGNGVTFIRCGTPGYIAPEVLNNEESLEINTMKHTKASDVFAIGVILYIM